MLVEPARPTTNDSLDAVAATWRWICTDARFRDLPYQIETHSHGQVVMSPTYGWHRKLQFRIAQMLEARLPEGEGVIELAVHTRAGTKVPDAAWCSPAVWAQHRDALGASVAPEICVEVRSPSTTDAEMAAKRALYFEAGAEEVWICDADGTMHVYDASGELDTSRCAPNFPARVEL